MRIRIVLSIAMVASPLLLVPSELEAEEQQGRTRLSAFTTTTPSTDTQSTHNQTAAREAARAGNLRLIGTARRRQLRIVREKCRPE